MSENKRPRSKSRTPETKRRRISTDSQASSSSRRSSTPSIESWESFPEVIEWKFAAGKIFQPSKEEREDAKVLIDNLKDGSFVKGQTARTCKRQKSVRLDYQGSTSDRYTNLQIQTNKTQSKSIACVLVQEDYDFGSEWIKFALRKSLETGRKCRLRTA